MIRLAVSLFFLLSLTAPFGKQAEWRDYLQWEEQSGSSFDTADLDQILLNEFSRQLEKKALAILHEEGIEPISLSFAMHIDEENHISITGLDLLLKESDADRSAGALSRLNENFGLTATLALEKEDGKDG